MSCEHHATARRKITTHWIPPPLGSPKLNTDGAVKGKPGPAGIGGVLRDDQGFIKGTLSNHIDIEDSKVAEFQTIRGGIRFFLLSLEVESNSSNPISWAKDHSKRPPVNSLHADLASRGGFDGRDIAGCCCACRHGDLDHGAGVASLCRQAEARACSTGTVDHHRRCNLLPCPLLRSNPLRSMPNPQTPHLIRGKF
ncbi:Uncharacterized protein TCM_012226 [Theobroma cacao]|uniref:RNase H type-1 domain-containing protein n=1 Tax=Theobroma cacao TaxID=3641 RepID=A0A061FVI7_THECC|nr:Uncharacterized protein TCM_012226 [Theobroma cacao]